MADNVELNAGSGGVTLKTDELADTTHVQYVKLMNGTADATDVIQGNATNGLEVDVTRVAGTVTVDASGTAVPVTDNGGSLTIDNAALTELAAAINTNQLDVNIATDSVGIGGGTQYTEDDAAAANPVGNMNMAVRADSLAGVTTTDGDNIALRATNNGELYVKQTDSVPVTDAGGSLTVDGTVTANLSAADNAVLDQIDANTDFGAVVGGGAEATALRVTLANDSTGLVSIDDGGGSITIDGSVTADLGANNDVTVTGGNAHDGTTLGNPVLGGARATNSIEGITQVANADLTHIQADLNGVLITRPHTTLEEIITERVADTAGTSTNFTNFAAGGAGVHNYVTTISIYNSSATDGYVDFRDGSAGSVIFTAAAPAAGGSVINLPVPLKGAANTALAYDVSGALSTVYISVVGFQAQG